MMFVSVFYVVGHNILVGSNNKKFKMFPEDTHCKIRPLLAPSCLYMTLLKASNFIMGVYRKNLRLLSDPTEISFISGYIKSVDTYHVSFSSN